METVQGYGRLRKKIAAGRRNKIFPTTRTLFMNPATHNKNSKQPKPTIMHLTGSSQKKQAAKFFLTALLSIILLSCQETAKPEPVKEEVKPAFDLSSARKEIEDVNQKMMEFVTKGDSAGIASCYTQDAKLMFSGSPTAVGRSSIQSAFGGMLSSGVDKAELKVIDVFGSEDYLVEEGEVAVYVKDKQVGSDRYLVVWKKEDGKWKIFRDIATANPKAK